jgi:hypothetical protein
MKKIGSLTLALIAICFAYAEAVHPLDKAAINDWAQFIVNTKNETTPLLSTENQQHLRVVSGVQATGVRVDNYSTIAGRRARMGGSLYLFNKRFEPVNGILPDAKIEVVSTTADKVTIKNQTLSCTKIVRKVTQVGWNGTSAIWLCPDIPVGGLVKIENHYQSQLTPDSKPNQIVETWLLTDFGFKNWKE